MTKTTSAPLAALLATRQFYTAKLFTLTLSDGTISYYCSGDKDITSNAHLFSCGGQTGPYFERTDNKAKVHWKIGTNVDALVFDVIPGSATIKNLAWLTAVLYGVFDGANILYQKAYMPTYGDTSVGVYDMFLGRVGDVSFGRKAITFTVNSYLELTNQNLPLNYYQAGCNNTLYDASCTLSAAAFSANGSVAAGSSGASILAALGAATSFFDLGKIVMTSGAMSGFAIGVKSWTQGSPNGTLLLNKPFPAQPAVGDTFTVYAGCDKQQTTCAGKFSNFANFRGTPYVPVPESAS